MTATNQPTAHITTPEWTYAQLRDRWNNLATDRKGHPKDAAEVAPLAWAAIEQVGALEQRLAVTVDRAAAGLDLTAAFPAPATGDAGEPPRPSVAESIATRRAAQAYADTLIADAEHEAAQLIEDAIAEAASIRGDARAEADHIVGQAKAEAQRLLDTAAQRTPTGPQLPVVRPSGNPVEDLHRQAHLIEARHAEERRLFAAALVQVGEAAAELHGRWVERS